MCTERAHPDHPLGQQDDSAPKELQIELFDDAGVPNDAWVIQKADMASPFDGDLKFPQT